MPALQPTFVLVHSPLVGALTWKGVAGELRTRGFEARVPSLAAGLDLGAPYWLHLVEAITAAVQSPEPVLLVGHSGGGALLSLAGAALEQPVAGYLFVDATLPRGGASALECAPSEFVALLHSLARDGWLPPWSDWWGEDSLRAHVPDDALRARFIGELRPIPLALFEERHPEVPAWPDAPCAYLQLSPPYDDAATEACALGWPVRRLQSHHLAMLVEPARIADTLLDLAGAVLRSVR